MKGSFVRKEMNERKEENEIESIYMSSRIESIFMKVKDPPEYLSIRVSLHRGWRNQLRVRLDWNRKFWDRWSVLFRVCLLFCTFILLLFKPWFELSNKPEFWSNKNFSINLERDLKYLLPPELHLFRWLPSDPLWKNSFR